MPGSLDRRSLLRAGLLMVAGLVTACSSDRGTLTAPEFGEPVVSAAAAGAGATAGATIASVAMVGDSITVRAEGPLEEGFRSVGLDTHPIDAANGRRIAVGGPSSGSGLDVVAAMAATDPPDLWVIALGSNDVFQYDGTDEYLTAIGTLLSAVPEGAPVVWVDTYLAADPARCDEFNQALRDAIAFRGTASVANWAAVAPGEGVLTDGIHPSAEGTQQFAAVVMAAVQQWLG